MTAEEPPAETRLQPGAMLDHFKVLRLIGHGGMGEVYLARDTRLGRRVALKLVPSDQLLSARAKRLYRAEAQATARLSHPNIVTIYHVGEHEGSPYLALEYLEGQTLRERMRENMPGIREVERIGLAISAALLEAHRSGIYHQDLKPENVLIPRDGRLRVLDFGLAANIGQDLVSDSTLLPVTDPEEAPTTIDQAEADTIAQGARSKEDDAAEAPSMVEGLADVDLGTVDQTLVVAKRSLAGDSMEFRGSPPYMAPEQWRNETTTGATDIWSLGVILHEMAVGSRPYEVRKVAQLAQLVISPDSIPRSTKLMEIPAPLSALIEQCLEKDPDNRPTAEEVGQTLRQLLQRGRGDHLEDECPFRGLLPFSEQHAEFFYGRDAEVAAFVERSRHQPVLPVVGPSGAGKSSFIQAGVFPRMREQGPWMILQLRPRSRPFDNLASALILWESSIRTTNYLESAETVDLRTELKKEASAERQKAESKSQEADSERQEFRLTRNAPKGREEPEFSSEEVSVEPQVFTEDVSHLARQLFASPQLLSLRLQQLAEEGNTRVLLFVDQLEELYTLVDDEKTRRRFMQAICLAADDYQDPVRVVFTLRDDFLGRVAEGAETRDALSHVTVIRMPGREALHDILTKPLETAGYDYDDPDLVDDMITDVEGELTSLPLLQFTAQMLWEKRDTKRRLLLRSTYASMGGVAGALAEHADAVLEGLPPEQVRLARRMLLRLVTPDGTRRVLSQRAALEGLDPEAEKVLDRLTHARLISVRKGHGGETAEGEVELVHESLIETWGRLERWINESHEELAFLAEIEQAADLWEKRGRREEEVWEREALREAQRTRERTAAQLPELVEQFLEAGLRKEQGFRRGRRLRRMLVTASLIVLAVVSLVVAWAFSNKEREASRQRDQAQTRRAEAQREGARAAMLRGELVEARAKLRGSLEIQDSPLARALLWTLSRLNLLWKKEVGAFVYTLDYSPDGRTLAASCQDKTIYLFNTRTLEVRFLRGHQDQVMSLAFSPDGRSLASAEWKGEVRVWNLQSGTARILGSHTTAVWGLEYTPDGSMLVSGSNDGIVRFWDLREGGNLRKEFKANTAAVGALSIHPDGKLLATGSQNGAVRFWELPTGRLVRALKGHQREVAGVAFSTDGSLLASASRDKTVRIWDIKKWAPYKVLRGHTSGVNRVVFSPDGKTLASCAIDRTVRVWDVVAGRQTHLFKGHTSAVYSVVFSPDGRAVASASFDKTIRVWNLSARPKRAAPHGHTALIYGISFSPDGSLVASGGQDSTIRIWDVKTGVIKQLLSAPRSTFGVDFSPDGKRLASAHGNGSILLWNPYTGEKLRQLKMSDTGATEVAFSPDGRLVVAGNHDDSVQVWDTRSGALLHALKAHEGDTYGVDFSPDGKLLASASLDRTVRVWDVRSGALKRTFTGHKGGVFGVVFSPDSKQIYSGSEDKTVRQWDLATGKGRIMARHPARVYNIQVHPDGKRVGAPGADYLARIWEISTGEHVLLQGHRGEVNFLDFSKDGKLVATTSDDETVRVWDAETGKPFWRAPVMLRSLPEILTHQGWKTLEGPPLSRPHKSKWRQAIEQRARLASESGDHKLLCIRTHDDRLEAWDQQADRRLFSTELPRLQKVVALPAGCLALAAGPSDAPDRGDALLFGRSGSSKKLSDKASAITWDQEVILVATNRQILEFGVSGETRGTYPCDLGVRAVTRVGDWLVLGNQDGNIELVPLKPGVRKPSFTFEHVQSSPVVELLEGPRGTVIVGYANGLVGIWDVANGTRLEHARLHGPVVHLLHKKGKLFAATELGDYLVLSLGVFDLPYCELMEQMWRTTPVVWEGGLPVRRPPPENHRCSARWRGE